MEPITTTAISTIVGYLAKTLKENKTFDDFTKDFTSATINWIRPLFLVDDKPKEVLEDLKTDPDDKLNIVAVENFLAKLLKKQESAEKYLSEMYEIIKAKEAKGESIKIINSKNVVIGNNTVQGDFIVGGNNQIGK